MFHSKAFSVFTIATAIVSHVYSNEANRLAGEGKILASDGRPFSFFGHRVATDGKLAFVSTQTPKDVANNVYVYRHTRVDDDIVSPTPNVGPTKDYDDDDDDDHMPFISEPKFYWEQSNKLSSQHRFEAFATTIAAADGTLFVGAPSAITSGPMSGAVYIYDSPATAVKGPAAAFSTLIPSDPMPGRHFGSALAATSGLVVVGAEGDESVPGAAYIFRLRQMDPIPSTPVPVSPPPPSAPASGSSDPIDGPALTSVELGSFLVTERSSVSLQAHLKKGLLDSPPPSSPAPPGPPSPEPRVWVQDVKLTSPTASDVFGSAVSVSASTVAVAAVGYGRVTGERGAVYVYHMSPNPSPSSNPDDWIFLTGLLEPDDVAAQTRFGSTIHFGDTRGLVSAIDADTGRPCVNVFARQTIEMKSVVSRANASQITRTLSITTRMYDGTVVGRKVFTKTLTTYGDDNEYEYNVEFDPPRNKSENVELTSLQSYYGYDDDAALFPSSLRSSSADEKDIINSFVDYEWVQIDKLFSPAIGPEGYGYDFFGASLFLFNDRFAVVGAPVHPAAKGAVYVFGASVGRNRTGRDTYRGYEADNVNETWSLAAVLTSPSVDPGNVDIDPASSPTFYGCSLAGFRDGLLVGAEFDFGLSVNSGVVYYEKGLFSRLGNTSDVQVPHRDEPFGPEETRLITLQGTSAGTVTIMILAPTVLLLAAVLFMFRKRAVSAVNGRGFEDASEAGAMASARAAVFALSSPSRPPLLSVPSSRTQAARDIVVSSTDTAETIGGDSKSKISDGKKPPVRVPPFYDLNLFGRAALQQKHTAVPTSEDKEGSFPEDVEMGTYAGGKFVTVSAPAESAADAGKSAGTSRSASFPSSASSTPGDGKGVGRRKKFNSSGKRTQTVREKALGSVFSSFASTAATLWTTFPKTSNTTASAAAAAGVAEYVNVSGATSVASATASRRPSFEDEVDVAGGGGLRDVGSRGVKESALTLINSDSVNI